MNWATIVPLLIGSGVTLVSTVVVEYLKILQANRAANRERVTQIRRELHDIVIELQLGLNEMIKVADQIVQRTATQDEAVALRAKFNDVIHRCVLYQSRLPREDWYTTIEHLIEYTTGACDDDIDMPETQRRWEKARSLYFEAVDSIAAPLKEHFRLGLSSADMRAKVSS